MPFLRALAGLTGAGLLLLGCTVGPNYVKPAAPTSAAFKEMAGWKLASPQDAIDRGAWWSIYHDPTLDKLEPEVAVSNQNLKAAEAAYRQSQAIVGEARAGLFPTLNVGGSVLRHGSGTGAHTLTANTGTVQGSALWDLDVWGRIRRTVESDVAGAQASAADLALATLSAQAALATDYYNLRAADALESLLLRTAADYERALRITENQYAVGVAARSDVITAQALLQATQARATGVGVQRSQFEHAMAVLVGRPPSELSIPAGSLATAAPVVPPSVPSALLERRPDIAAAERAMQQENALVGVAVAAFYPDISLSAVFAYAGNPTGAFLSVANRFWALGAAATVPLFDGGLRSASVAAAAAAYDQSVATYRETVLLAFQQVEDQLAALRILAEQAVQQDAAVKSAQQAERISLNEYAAGTVAYTAVVTAQAAALTDEETAVSIQLGRLAASVGLVEALGGGWDTAQLPTADDLQHPPSLLPIGP